MVQGHHLQLRRFPQLFHNLRLFNIMAVMAHPSIIQKVDELLVKGAIESSTGSTDFYSNIFVVPK